MHRRANSESRRSTEYTELSDLSDPEFLELGPVSPTPGSFNPSFNDRIQNLEEKSSSGKYFNNVYIKAVVSLICWYFFSISISVYNKHMFSETGMDFKFPVITTAIHQLTQIVLALIALAALRIPTNMNGMDQKLKIIPAGIASALDIGLGNSSLLIVTLSFYTMIKSSALGFVLLFSVMFKIENPKWQLAAIISVMTIGVFLMVAGETDFNLVGFFLVLGASCASGLRWALIKLLMIGDIAANSMYKKAHPVQTILALSPIMFVTLGIWGLILEGPKSFLSAPLWQHYSIPMGICVILFPGLLAFGMTWAEFELLNATGPLTLAVAGICKEVATIIVSIFVFHDKLSVINGVGLAVTAASIALYHYYRIA